MTRLVGFLVIVLIVIGVIGYYQGWLNVSSANQGGTTNVNVTLDKEKMKESEEKAVKKVQDASRQLKEKVGGQTSSSDK